MNALFMSMVWGDYLRVLPTSMGTAMGKLSTWKNISTPTKRSALRHITMNHSVTTTDEPPLLVARLQPRSPFHAVALQCWVDTGVGDSRSADG